MALSPVYIREDCMSGSQPFRFFKRTFWSVLLFWLSLAASAQAQTTATQTRWFQQQGQIVKTNVTFSQNGDVREFNYAAGPNWNANRWRYTPNAVNIDYKANSRLCGGSYKCKRDLDFMYFSTEVRIPSNATINSFVLKTDNVDDALRVTIFNSNYPQGIVPPGTYLYFNGSKKQTSDFGRYLKKNDVNTILVTVVDDCCQHMKTGKIELLLNGKPLALRNSAPVVTGLPPNCAEAGKVYSSIPVKAYDPENDPLEFTMLSGPTGSTVNSRTGYVSWTPRSRDIGRTFTFSMHVCDDLKAVVIKNWTVTVKRSCSTNSPPRITSNPSRFGTEDRKYTYNAKATDPDSGDVLTWKLLKGPTGASISSSSGTLTWTPGDASAGKNVDFEIQVCDKANACVKQSWRVYVVNVNDPPTIAGTPPTTATYNRQTTYSPRVIDPDPNERHTWRQRKGPSGSRLDSSTGRWTWTPNSGQIGKTYDVEIEVCDRSRRCARQTWKIKVGQTNRAPRITSRPATSATEDQTYTYNAKAYDPDSGDVLTWKLLKGPSGSSISSSSGTLTWKPGDANANRSYDFEIQVCDKANTCDKQSWRVYVRNVNDAPKIISRPSTTATERQPYSYTARASDPDPGERLTWKLLKGPSGSSMTSGGRLTWTPGSSNAGKTYDFEIQVCDKAGACAKQSWKVTVRNVNDAPKIVGTPPTKATVSKRVTYSPRVVDNDPGDSHTWRVKRGPAGATINSGSGVWTWIPTRTQANKTYDVEIEVCDKARACATQKWRISVGNAPNTPPKITTKPPTTATEDQTYTYQVQVFDPDAGDVLTWKLLKGPAGTKIRFDNGWVSWTPGDANVLKTYDFEIQVCDKAGACDKQAWKVTVKNVNDAPKIVGTPPRQATARAKVTYRPKVVDPDPNESHTWKLNKGPNGAAVNPSTGEWTWTPGNGDVGKTFDVEIQVCDKAGACDKQFWKITVKRAPNSPPKITSTPPKGPALEDQKYTYNAKATDPDGDRLAWSVLQGPQGLSINPTTGVVTWTPTNANAAQTFTIVIEVCDPSGACDTQNYKLHVQNTNDAPKIVGTPPTAIAETRTMTYSPKVVDPDVGDFHNWKLNKGPNGASLDSKTGKLTWTPKRGEGGKTVDFEIQVCDQQRACDTQKFKVKVLKSNTPPKITGSPLLVATPDVAYTAQFGVNDPDPGDTHTWKLLKAPTGAKVDNTGKVTWTPARADANKSFDFEVQVCDKAGDCDKRPWKVTVGNANNAPKITSTPDDNATVGEPWTYGATANDPDTGDTLTWKLKKGPAGSSMDSSSGKVSWTPGAADSDKPTDFTIEVCDNGKPVRCATQSFKITPRTRCKVDVNCKSDYICVQQSARRVCLPPGCATKSPKCQGADFCKDGNCGKDPCANKTCPTGSTCRSTDGKCIRTCDKITCGVGQRCDGGTCIKDPCNGCKTGEVCDTSNPASPTCTKNPCSAGSCKHGRVCDYGRCIDDPCGRMTCPTDQTCRAGQCVPRKPCNVDVDCPSDEVCISNRCTKPGCYTAPCSRSQQCLSAQCKDDLCRKNGGQSCGQAQFCRPQDGKCVVTCSGVTCPDGQRCVDGTCSGDPCYKVNCKGGEICVAGKCETDHCVGSKRCKHGRVCSKDKNECVDDPCYGVKCPDSNEVCVDGQCQSPPACRFDKECSKGLICVKGKCIIPSCTKDGDCKPNNFCIDGQCTPDPCLNVQCKDGEFCRNGKCIGSCSGVFCKTGEQCVDGNCVGDPCAKVTCKADETCRDGKCIKDPCEKDSCRYSRVCDGKKCTRDPCSDVNCPKGQTCNDGQCTGDKPCNVDVDCPGDAVCVSNKCTPSGCYKATCADKKLCSDASCEDNPCENKQCGAGETCRPTDGKCIPDCPACPSGEVCKEGQCQADPCDGVTCQDGERCKEGQCIKDPCAKQGAALCRYQRVCNSNACKDDPCTGMKCADGYQCRNGQCTRNPSTDGGDKEGGDGEPVGDAGDGDDAGQTDSEPTDGEPAVADKTNNTRDVVRGTRGGYGDDTPTVAPPVGCACAANGAPTPLGLLWLLLLVLPFYRRRRK
jgi:MYXO-CTERM domain-containing protein